MINLGVFIFEVALIGVVLEAYVCHCQPGKSYGTGCQQDGSSYHPYLPSTTAPLISLGCP